MITNLEMHSLLLPEDQLRHPGGQQHPADHVRPAGVGEPLERHEGLAQGQEDAAPDADARVTDGDATRRTRYKTRRENESERLAVIDRYKCSVARRLEFNIS